VKRLLYKHFEDALLLCAWL